MDKRPPLVSIIVLSHDRPGYLARALDSVAGQSYRNLEILVVDNKSRSSDEIARLVSQYRGVRLIQNGVNLGFTGGMNRGLEAATGHYVHCTVDDVILDRDCIRHLVEYAQEHLSDGLLSGVIYDEKGETILCAGGEFMLTPIYRQKVLGQGEKDAGQFRHPFNVTCLQGGMVFSRLQFMRRLKGFREDFFIYSDSIELSARVLKSGNPITIVPRAKVYVIDAPHAFTPEGIAFHKLKNLFALYLLHARLAVLPEFFLRYAVIAFLRYLYSNRGFAWPMIKAWGWCLVKMPSLLKGRYQDVG
jgi:GT2 family glycosyltransferase